MTLPMQRARARLETQNLREVLERRFAPKNATLRGVAGGDGMVALGGQVFDASVAYGDGVVSVANVGRPAAAVYAPTTGGGGVVVMGGSSGTGGGGVTDHGALSGLGDDDHPQYLTATRGDALFLTPAEGNAAYVPLARTVTAGAGLTVTPAGGALSANITLDVGAGNGITVNADDVAVKLHATTPGLFVDANGLRVSLKASNPGLVVDVNGLYMGAPGDLAWNTTGGLTATGHVHTIATSSNPGANASILQSDASGYLTLVRGIFTDRVRTPQIDTASGDLTLAPVGNVKLTSGTRIGSDNYASQTTGWAATYAGAGDFRYLFTDEMHAKSFIADLEQALAGGQIICKSVTALGAAFTAPANGGTATLTVKDLPSAPDVAVFVSGDIVRLRTFSRAGGGLDIANCWGVVTAYADQANGLQTWTFTRSSPPNQGSMATGTVVAADSIVLDYGTSGNGFYEVNAIDGAYAVNSPYAQVVTWTTHPATGQTVRTRNGNLNGIFGVANEFGLYAGSGVTDADQYLRLSSNTFELHNLLINMFNGAANTGRWYANGSLALSSTSATTADQRDFIFDSGAGVLRIGRVGANTPNLYWTGSALQLRQNTTAVITLDSTGNSNFSGIMTIGAAGEIRQGTVASGNVWDSWASIGGGFTGLRVWRDGSIGRIAGYNGGTAQWYADTDGKLYAGGGLVVLGATGIRLTEQARGGSMPIWNASALTFVDTGDVVRSIVAAYKRTTGSNHGVVFGTTNPSVGQTFQYGVEVEDSGSVNIYGNTGIYGPLTATDAFSGTTGAFSSTLSVTGVTTLGDALNSTAANMDIKHNGAVVIRNHVTGDSYMRLGNGRTANGYALFDLVGDTDYPLYGLRVARGNTGKDAVSFITHRGAGDFSIQTNEAANLLLRTNGVTRVTIADAGAVTIAAPTSGPALTVNGTIKAGDSEGMKLVPAQTRTISGSSTLTLAATSFYGYIFVINTTAARVGMFAFANAISVLGPGSSGMSVTKNTASAINVYPESGNYIVQNTYTAAQTLAIFYLLGS